ncbi:MAG TPA: serine/threonine-protein kinase [Polyangia bacterium]|nr:serine/threonine-protein kinase [Polyangia bacterium]
MAVQLPQPIQFGKYTLFERIGRGGMADVYKGRVQGPEGFERVFVIKRILPHLSDEPTFIKMFVEEAKLSARLSHPNIVQIFELGSVEGEYFISMEYVRGRDLAETMRAIWKTMPPPRPELVAYIGREACRALAYAHDLTDDNGRPLRMIHRDVSPSNIMLSYEGAVKLLDFGIAKALGEAPETTKSGTMKGKYAYMAPEQTEGDDVDHRIDIFSCGIVLHEVLTGRRLFKGANDVQTIERVRKGDVAPPSFQNPLCPPELDAIVLKALARNRDDRFAHAAEMADALDDVVHRARFQPTHLAQTLHQLFAGEGTGTFIARPTTSTGGTGSGGRSPTVPPVQAPTTGTGQRPSYGSFWNQAAGAAAASKRRSRWMFPAAATVVALIGAAIIWSAIGTSNKAGGSAGAATPGHTQRFNVFVKSDPPGADIFLDGASKPIGATPVTLPIELDGAAVKMVLKKSGFEPYEQLIASDTPLSISLRAEVTSAPASTSASAAPPAPAPTAEPPKPRPPAPRAEPVEKPPAPAKRPVATARRESTPAAAKRRAPPASKAKPAARSGGELVNPF